MVENALTWIRFQQDANAGRAGTEDPLDKQIDSGIEHLGQPMSLRV